MSTYIRGALIEFMPTLLIPIPNVIMFQYNPETLTHTWTQPQPVPAEPHGQRGNPLAVQGYPGEAFAFTLAMDANDTIADGDVGADLAKVTGIYSRIAALEMLVQPAQASAKDGLLGTVTSALAGAISGGSKNKARQVPANKLSVVLFVWGPGRVVPVRVTSLTITEQRFDTLLSPIHAEAQVGLQVLTPEDVNAIKGDTLAAVAKAANSYTDSLRQALAVANLVNAADSIIGMIPH